MDERLRFVARLLDGENMSRVCREFGISRPTGYKIFNRYKDRVTKDCWIAVVVRTGTPTSYPFNLKVRSLGCALNTRACEVPDLR